MTKRAVDSILISTIWAALAFFCVCLVCVGQPQARRYHRSVSYCENTRSAVHLTTPFSLAQPQKVHMTSVSLTYSIVEKKYCRDFPLDSVLSAMLFLSGVDVKINNLSPYCGYILFPRPKFFLSTILLFEPLKWVAKRMIFAL